MRNWIAGFFVLAMLAAQASAVTFNVTRSGAYTASGFGITEVQQTPDRIYPGDEVRLKFSIQSNDPEGAGTVELNVLAPFLPDTSNYLLGDMNKNEPKDVTVNFVVPANTNPGSYYMYIYTTSKYGSRAQVAEIPITINELSLSNALAASVGDMKEVYAGDSVEMPIEIRNYAELGVEDVIVQMKFDSGNALTPIGSDRQHIDAIAAGESGTAPFKVGVNPSATAGYYPLTIYVSYKIDRQQQPQVNQTFGIRVLSRTALLITYDTAASATGTSGASLVVTVANVGDTPVRGVYISAESDSFDFSGASDKFIGTLNLDDSASISLAPTAKRSAFVPGQAQDGTQAQQAAGLAQGVITVKAVYKDALNVEHTQSIDVQYRPQGLAADSANGQTGALSNQRFGRRTQGYTILGIDVLYIGIGIAALLVAFFGWKWYKRRDKK
ncbi:MAG: hypothetical protein V1787_02145 [Candidatus Micrarchaeota archaeon]